VERRRGNGTQALEHFERAVALDSSDATSLFRIGQLRDAQNDLPGAIEAYERAVRLDPSAPVREALENARARLEFSRLPEQYRAIESAPQVTRAALAALIGVRLSRLVNGATATTPVVLTDVRSTWAEPWIMAVTQAGVMEGYANHTFQPESSVPRIDLARVVAQLLPRVASPGALRVWQTERRSFADLSSAHLAYPAASTAVASGVMSAMADNRFESSRPVTGQEAVAAIERLVALAGDAGRSSATR
jgi:tetratricopeptide (TPR) repeat protein